MRPVRIIAALLFATTVGTLAAAGLVATRRAGREVLYRPTPAPMSEALAWMAGVRRAIRDIDWDEFFSALAEVDFYQRPDTVMVSSVFAEDENAHEVSRYQLNTMTDYVSKYGR